MKQTDIHFDHTSPLYMQQTDIHFAITSRSFLLGMRNVADRSCVENQNTHFVFHNIYFEHRAVYEIMWKNIVERVRPQMAKWRMRIACWIPKATDTHSEYVTLKYLPLQQWLHERASVLRYTLHCCVVITKKVCVYCAVGTVSLCTVWVNLRL
jgi:hypothetical protein